MGDLNPFNSLSGYASVCLRKCFTVSAVLSLIVLLEVMMHL